MQNTSNYSVTPLPEFGEARENVVTPIVMFMLNVLGNGLAIGFLIRYKLRGDATTSKVRKWQVNWSRDTLNHTHNDSQANHDERRPTSESPCSFTRPRPVRPHVKFGMFHTLVSILAVLDLSGAIAVSPITIILYLKTMHIKEYGGDSLCFYSAFAMLYFGFTTMAMVMSMSIERLFSIRYAFLYREMASAHKAVILAAIIFVFAAVICAMPVYGLGAIRAMPPYSWCFADWNAELPKDKAFNYLYVSLGILMLLTTLVCNVLVIIGLISMRKKLSPFRSTRNRFLSQESQMIIQLLAITAIFVICWTPLLCQILINQLGYSYKARIPIWLAITNPILDPWVYILCRRSVFQRINSKIKQLPCIKNIHTATPTEEHHLKLPLRHSPRLEHLKSSQC